MWTVNLPDTDISHYDLTCKPLVWNDNLIYAYKAIDKVNKDANGYYGTQITVIEFNSEGNIISQKRISFKYSAKERSELLSTRDWSFFSDGDNKIFLNVGFVLDLNHTEICIDDRKIEINEFKIIENYYFDEFHIKYNQKFLIECINTINNKIIWKIKTKGYLYTKITLKDECLIFGTAGRGGALYCIEKKSGKILTEYNNGDSSNFTLYNDFIITKDRNSNIVKINPFKNEVIDSLRLKDKITYSSSFLVNKDVVYTTVWSKKTKEVKMTCIKI